MKSKKPSIPRTLIELGIAVELDSTNWEWKWNDKDHFVVATDLKGKQIYIFKHPKTPKGAGHVGKISTSLKENGQAIHLIYKPKRKGKMLKKHIHYFDKKQNVFVDNPSKPSIIVLKGSIAIVDGWIEG